MPSRNIEIAIDRKRGVRKEEQLKFWKASEDAEIYKS
jgi:hypothetical protein